MNPIVFDFLRATYPDNLSKSPQDQGVQQPALELPVAPEADLLPLPAPSTLDIPSLELRTAIERRSTLRRYAEQPLTLSELSYLLWLTQGVKEVTKRPVTLRTVPSAGARHAFETLLLVNRIEGLEPGLYRFIAGQHALLRLPDEHAIFQAGLTHACLEQAQIKSSAVTFIWLAVTERMAWRYVERGMRYLHLDAGHVCQNLYLAAEAIGCGMCAIAAFDDDKMNDLLDLDGQNMFVIYLASLGKREKKA
jgi:SagB-type dehydrogenase family enzyme